MGGRPTPPRTLLEHITWHRSRASCGRLDVTGGGMDDVCYRDGWACDTC